MAKTSAVEKNKRRRKIVANQAAKRAGLKAIIMNQSLSIEGDQCISPGYAGGTFDRCAGRACLYKSVFFRTDDCQCAGSTQASCRGGCDRFSVGQKLPIYHRCVGHAKTTSWISSTASSAVSRRFNQNETHSPLWFMSSEKLKTIRDPIRLAIAIDDGQTWPGTSLTGGFLAGINRIEDQRVSLWADARA